MHVLLPRMLRIAASGEKGRGQHLTEERTGEEEEQEQAQAER